jgi:2-polyprenyl-3-methyl-5-hydroxy-6-metoxy-1,4-benzoquinol methylase
VSTRSGAAFSETDIRPDALMGEQAQRLDADIRRLLARRDEFVEVTCPACGAGPEAARPALEKYTLTFLLCGRCGTMYMSPRPSPAVLEDYYRQSENYAYWNSHIFPASEEVRREKIFGPRAERVAELVDKFDAGRALLLEVGAGFGTFCEEVQRQGVFDRVIAVEPTPDLAETCRRKGLDVLELPIERVVLDEPPSVITSFETLEHLFSPREFVAQCFSLLPAGGLLVLSCPNVQGFDVSLLRERSSVVDNEHLNYFHPESLGVLLADVGFHVLEATTPGELDAELVRKAALAGEVDLADQPFLRRVLLDDWDTLGGPFQRFLAANGMSTHMWVVARKP